MCDTSNRRRADNPAGSPGRRYWLAGAVALATSASVTEATGSPATLTTPSCTSRSSSATSSIRAATCRARSRTASAAACTALPATTVVREAQDPMPNGIRAVSPFTTRTTSGLTPRASAAICAIAVSMPCPNEVPPENTLTAPVPPTVTTAVSCGPSPLFSRNRARPRPRSRPSSRPRATSS
jgi:hypothetical protein